MIRLRLAISMALVFRNAFRPNRLLFYPAKMT